MYLPPFKAAFDAGAGSVMSAFNEIDGVPATASSFSMRQLLRDEWRWPGVVLSDYEAVRELIPHGVAADLKDAARLSLLAGLDMDMMSEAYSQHLAELVEDGALDQQLIDEATRRVLRLKLRLGLFERPYVDESLAGHVVLRDDMRALALEVARQSMVLLKTGTCCCLCAPRAASPYSARWPTRGAICSAPGRYSASPTMSKPCSTASARRSTAKPTSCMSPAVPSAPPSLPISEAATAAAQSADVVVLVLGESADMSGEAHSRTHLGLPGRQAELVDAVAATGTPIVAVLLCGRPLVIPRLAEQAAALLVAWHGGIRAGRAVADLLFGVAVPSGKLTAGWPRTEGQIPVYYNQKNTGRPKESEGTTQFFEAFKTGFIDEPNEPLYAFGHGLSYTTFEYRELALERTSLGLDDTIEAGVVVRNSGTRSGVEVVQLYIRDLVGSVTRPVRELKGFQRVELQPGTERRVSFQVAVRELGCTGAAGSYIVEPGDFRLWIGSNSSSGLEAGFEVR